MRKLIAFMAVSAVLFLSCGALHKVEKRALAERDTSSSIKRDSSSSSKKDSSSHVVDRSVITTKEHIINELEVPGKKISNQARLQDLLLHPNMVVSDDGADTLRLSYDNADNTVKATLYQKAQKLKQTIDRTIQTFNNVDTKTVSKTDANVNIKNEKKASGSAKKETADTVTEREGFPWIKLFLLVAAIVGAGLLVLFIYQKITRKNIL